MNDDKKFMKKVLAVAGVGVGYFMGADKGKGLEYAVAFGSGGYVAPDVLPDNTNLKEYLDGKISYAKGKVGDVDGKALVSILIGTVGGGYLAKSYADGKLSNEEGLGIIGGGILGRELAKRYSGKSIDNVETDKIN